MEKQLKIETRLNRNGSFKLKIREEGEEMLNLDNERELQGENN